MKKFYLLMMACLVAIGASAWSVKFTNPDNWSTVKVYTYNPEGNGKWPGSDMTKGSDGVWSYTSSPATEAAPAYIIFHNGSGSQTGDLTFGATNDGKTYDKSGPVGAQLNDYSVYFDNSASNWQKVYAYCWDGVSSGSWPGTEVTKKDSRGYYVFEYFATAAPGEGAKIIWNNGGNGAQTANLSYVPGTVYDKDGPKDAQAETYTVYFKNVAGWPQVYVYTFNPELAGAWPGTEIKANSDGTYQWDLVSKVAPSCEGIIFSDGGSNQTDNLEYTVGATYTNAGGGWPGAMYVIGTINGEGWNPTNVAAMTDEGDGIFTIENLTLSENSGSCGFALTEAKGTSSDDWDTVNARRYGPATTDTPAVVGENPVDGFGDLSWSIAPGVYNMTFDFDSKILEIEQVGTTMPTKLYIQWGLNSDETDNWTVTVGGAIATDVVDGVATFSGMEIPAISEANYGYFCFSTEDGGSWDALGDRYAAAKQNDPISVEGGDVMKPGEVMATATLVPGSQDAFMIMADSYDLKVDLNNNTVQIIKNAFTTGVEDIAVDGANAAAVYFNLQGVRVVNPTAGQLLIKKEGSNVSKVLVK